MHRHPEGTKRMEDIIVMPVRMIIDSSTDLPPELRNQVTVIPLSIHFDGEDYLDGVTIDHKMFYEKLVQCKSLPSTSQAGPFVFEKAFREAVDNGDTVVAVTISSKLSGTYQSAAIAAAEFPGKVFVVDSRSVTIGAAVLVQYGLELMKRGMDAESIAEELMQKRDQVHMLAILDTLDYLKKGGRISSAAALAGSLLNIKPVVCIENGEIKMLGKARGAKQASQLLVQEVAKAGSIDFGKPVLLGYTGLSTALLEKFTADIAALWSDHHTPASTVVGSVVGTHAGPGAVAIAFFSAGK